jgi:hypothetical protein
MTSEEETQLIQESCTESSESSVPICVKPVAVKALDIDTEKKEGSAVVVPSNNDEFVMSDFCLRLVKAVSIKGNSSAINNPSNNHKAAHNGSYNGNKSLIVENDDELLDYDDEDEEQDQENALVYPLKVGVNKIGRAELNHIVILSKGVSKKHGCIEVSSDGKSCQIWDCGSINKIKLNNETLKENEKHKIEMEDLIEFNLTSFTFSKVNGILNIRIMNSSK